MPTPVALVDIAAERILLGVLMREPRRLTDARVRRALFALSPHARAFDALAAAHTAGLLGGDLLTASAALEGAALDAPRTLAADCYLAAEDVLPDAIVAHIARLARRRQIRALSTTLAAVAEHPSPVPAEDRETLATAGARVVELAEATVPDAPWRCLADVAAERVAWLWQGRIPLGKVTLLEGDPGLGKSTLTLELAARVSQGAPLEGDRTAWDPAGVLLIGAEDGLADTLRPRLEAAGADLTRIAAFQLERLPTLPDELDAVRSAMRAIRALLVIFDPLMAFLASGVDSYRDQDVRRVLRDLAGLAAATGAAVVIVRHLTKQSGSKALYRGGGSIGIAGAARSVLLLAADPDAPEERVLAPVKTNLCAPPPALRFALVPHADSVRLAWLGTSTRLADDLVAPEDDDASAAVAEALAALEGLLTAGPVAASRADRERRELGIGERAWRIARRRLRVESVKESFSGGWVWRLPTKGVTH